MKRVAAREVVEREPFGGREVGVAVLMNEFFLRHMLAVYAVFGGDLLQAVVLAQVANHSVSALTSTARTPRELIEWLDLAVAAPRSALLPSNAYAIAQVTGIPRETVRRKVDALVRRGWLTRDDGAHLFISDGALAHIAEFNIERLGDLLASADKLRDVLEPAKADGRGTKRSVRGTAGLRRRRAGA